MDCIGCGSPTYHGLCFECEQKLGVYDGLVEALQSVAAPPHPDSSAESLLETHIAIAKKALLDAGEDLDRSSIPIYGR